MLSVRDMRLIDRFIGKPLCFVATIGLQLWTIIRKSAPRPLKRILFIELSETGSIILADPAMRKAKNQLHAEIYFLVFTANAAGLNLIQTVPSSNILTIRNDNIRNLVVDTIRFLRDARAINIDTVIDLESFSRYSGLLTGLSGADRRVGFYRFHNEGLYRGRMLTHPVVFNPHIHIAKNFVALVNALLFPALSSPYSKTTIADTEVLPQFIEVTESARTMMLERIRKLAPSFDPEHHRIVLVNPNSSDLVPQRRWMLERFSEVIDRILAEHEDIFVLITGVIGEQRSLSLADRCGQARCISFVGHAQLRELPALYTISSAMVTNDSGPGHFSSTTGMPTIVLFGPETPKLYSPLGGHVTVIYVGLACSPCVSVQNHRQSPCTDNICMQQITVDAVYQALCNLLERGSMPKS